MSRRTRVLVTGANGFIGSWLVDRLAAQGHRVRAMVRRSSDLRRLSAEVEIVHADVTAPVSLPPVLEGIDRVFHVAGVVAAHRSRDYTRVNVAGTRSLLAAVRKVRPDLDRFVLISSLAAAGPSPRGRALVESDPPRPVSRYGLSKLRGEEVLRAEAGTIPWTIVRPPIVYGPRDADLLELFRLVDRGRDLSFAEPKYYSVCHVEDLVRGIVKCSESGRAAGRTYYLADPRAYTIEALFAAMSGALGRRTRSVPVPTPLLRLVGPVADALLPSLGIRARPIGDKVRELLPNYWIADPGRARRELGFRTRRTLCEGFAETAGFYRDEGLLP